MARQGQLEIAWNRNKTPFRANFWSRGGGLILMYHCSLRKISKPRDISDIEQWSLQIRSSPYLSGLRLPYKVLATHRISLFLNYPFSYSDNHCIINFTHFHWWHFWAIVISSRDFLPPELRYTLDRQISLSREFEHRVYKLDGRL